MSVVVAVLLQVLLRGLQLRPLGVQLLFQDGPVVQRRGCHDEMAKRFTPNESPSVFFVKENFFFGWKAAEQCNTQDIIHQGLRRKRKIRIYEAKTAFM